MEHPTMNASDRPEPGDTTTQSLDVSPDLTSAHDPWGPLPAASFPEQARTRRGGRGRTLALVLSAALLSASLSAAGSYLAFTAMPRATAASASAAQANAVQLTSISQSDVVVRVAALASPSVVTITTTESAGPVQATGTGSGLIVGADGLILTSNHVISGASSLHVTLADGRSFPATVVSTDRTNDLAIIRIAATGLKALSLGDSSTVKLGQLAIAIGNPLGVFQDSVTQGVVSGLDREITVGDRATGQSDLKGLIQTDAAVNPGNSGGPLLDSGGSVIGIVAATSSSAQGMAFAVPINDAKAMVAAALA
jgi:serine protease Do